MAEPETGGAAPDEEELRAALEEQMREIRVEDLLLQSVASLVNLTARRIAKPDERDLGQAKLGIDAVTAMADLLPAEAAGQIQNALAELRMLYAKAAAEGDEGPGSPSAAPRPDSTGSPSGASQPDSAGSPPQSPSQQRKGQEPPPRLWTPGSG